MRPLSIVLLAAAMAAGTVFVAWWTIPVIAATYALLARHHRVARDSALAALCAWAALLIHLSRYDAFSSLLAQLGQIFPVPGAVVAALTLALAAVLAASAARVAIGLTGVRETSVSSR